MSWIRQDEIHNDRSTRTNETHPTRPPRIENRLSPIDSLRPRLSRIYPSPIRRLPIDAGSRGESRILVPDFRADAVHTDRGVLRRDPPSRVFVAPHVAPTTISTAPADIFRDSQSTRLDIDCDDSSTRIGRVTSSATAVDSVARGRSTFDRPEREPPRSTNGLQQLSGVSPCNGPATDLRTATPAEQEPDDTPPRRPRSAQIRRVRRIHPDENIPRGQPSQRI
jgi:hypothetical protein